MVELTRENIVKETIEWLDTPYHHLAALKGVGCDCVGLIVGVWRQLKGELPVPPPVYSPQWHLHQKESMLIDVLENWYGFNRINTKIPPLGSVLCLGLDKGPAHHAGIMVSDTTFIHSFISSNKITEVPLDSKWRRRLHAVMDFPGLVEK